MTAALEQMRLNTAVFRRRSALDMANIDMGNKDKYLLIALIIAGIGLVIFLIYLFVKAVTKEGFEVDRTSTRVGPYQGITSCSSWGGRNVHDSSRPIGDDSFLFAGKKEGYMAKDLGPSAISDRALLPLNSKFIDKCKAAFMDGCATNPNVNVCGNDEKVTCQNFTDMQDMSCHGSKYIALKESDCATPYSYRPGYLCGAPEDKDALESPCAPINRSIGGSVILGPAPENVYGCTYICQ